MSATHRLEEVLDAATTSIAVFAHNVDWVHLTGAPVSDLARYATELITTLSRIQTLAVMHPDLTAESLVPAGAVGDLEYEMWAAETRVLDDLTAITPAPVAVRVVAEVPLRASDELAAVAGALNGMTLTVRNTFDGPSVSLSDALMTLAPADPEEEAEGEDGYAAFMASDNPAAAELRRLLRWS